MEPNEVMSAMISAKLRINEIAVKHGVIQSHSGAFKKTSPSGGVSITGPGGSRAGRPDNECGHDDR